MWAGNLCGEAVEPAPLTASTNYCTVYWGDLDDAIYSSCSLGTQRLSNLTREDSIRDVWVKMLLWFTSAANSVCSSYCLALIEEGSRNSAKVIVLFRFADVECSWGPCVATPGATKPGTWNDRLNGLLWLITLEERCFSVFYGRFKHRNGFIIFVLTKASTLRFVWFDESVFRFVCCIVRFSFVKDSPREC
jgi:hypothetical protein